MRSLSYIIILMSLIANCQSEKSSCISWSGESLSLRNQKFSQAQSHKNFKEFRRFFSENLYKFKKVNPLKFNVVPSGDIHDFARINFEKYINQKRVSYYFALEKKVSKIRNKDCLEANV